MRFAAGVLRYGQVYCHVLHMWMVEVESHREFWKCNANLLECGKCNLEFSRVPSFVPAGSGIGASRLSLLTDPKVTKYGQLRYHTLLGESPR
jgi:hypothetical protein